MSDVESPIARWLHLTDLHIGTTNESQAVAVMRWYPLSRNERLMFRSISCF